jgi:hypothetical protein
MASEMTLGEIKEFTETIQGFETIKQEVLHYLSQGVDYFTVSAGPWTIEYDNRKEREV